MDRKQQLLWLLGGFVVTAALCGIAAALAARWTAQSEPASTPDVAGYLTAAVSTSQALGTEAIPSPSPTASPAAKPTATSTPTSTASVPATPTPRCLAAGFVQDVTVPDGSTFAPGETFTKTWRLINRGTCPWTPAFALIFVGGERLGAPESVPLGQTVLPGAMVDIQVPMRAPTTPGEYQSYWKLRSDKGTWFGVGDDAAQPIWVLIRVVVTPTPTATATAAPPTATSTAAAATATPTPEITATATPSPTPTAAATPTPTNTPTPQPPTPTPTP